MKVKLGPYINWVGPYQIAEKLLWWMDKHEDTRVHNFGTWLATDKDGKDSWLMKVCNWVNQFKQRQEYVRIDYYDSWNAGNTLSLIALPLLLQLKATKHGSPNVDDEDVPPGMGLRSTEAPPKKDEWDTDANHHDRWEWVLDEIIWAHQQEALDDPAQNACWTHDVPDACWPFPSGRTGIEAMLDNIQYDEKAYAALAARKQNGFRLFGKYYQALWD